MNKILLSGILISVTLLTACSKNEAPEDSMQEEVSSPISEPLEVLGSSAVTAVEINREQTANTITEERKEFQTQIETAANNAQSAEASSEDDAVAAALAAANPAINNSYSNTPSNNSNNTNNTNNEATNTETATQQQ